MVSRSPKALIKYPERSEGILQVADGLPSRPDYNNYT